MAVCMLQTRTGLEVQPLLSPTRAKKSDAALSWQLPHCSSHKAKSDEGVQTRKARDPPNNALFRADFLGGRKPHILDTQLSRRLTFFKTAGVRIAGSAIHSICELRLLWPSPHPESGESDAISSIVLRF